MVMKLHGAISRHSRFILKQLLQEFKVHGYYVSGMMLWYICTQQMTNHKENISDVLKGFKEKKLRL